MIIGREQIQASGVDKTSLIVSMKNKPGALFHLLKPFNDAGVDLTRVETRPSNSGTWAYVFFIDFLCHLDDENIQQLMKKVEAESVEVKRLGSYPIAVL